MDHGEQRPFETVDRLIALIEKYDMVERSIINSFSERVLEYVADRWPQRYMIHGYPHYKNPKDFATVELESFSDWAVIWNKDEEHPAGWKEDYEAAARQDMLPCILVPDTVEAYGAAIEMGNKMFTSDDPAAAVRVLQELGYKRDAAKHCYLK